MLTPIRDRVVVITGGTKGIGRGIALACARQGARILITGRDVQAGHDCVNELADAGSPEAAFVAADVSRAEDCRRVADTAIGDFGALDVVVANAGIYPEASIAKMTETDIKQMLDVNLTGTILTVQACLSGLRSSAHGRVIVVSSITGPIVGMELNAHYAASKAGQVGFVRSAALEFAPFGVTVNAILPGNIETEGLADLGSEYRDAMIASIPQRRLGTPADVAGAALYLMSDEATFVTGQTIVVDGGQVLPESLSR